MGQNVFSCKAEEVTAIAGFLAESFSKDQRYFCAYSPFYNDPFYDTFVAKRVECENLITSAVVTNELKAITAKLAAKCLDFRTRMNRLEGYLFLSENGLDISVKDFGLSGVRDAINRGNMEGAIARGIAMMQCVKRNQTALTMKGLTEEFYADLESILFSMSELNSAQHAKIGERNRLTDANARIFNELWEMCSMVLDTGRLLFKEVDSVRLKAYTFAHLLSEVNAEGANVSKVSSPV